MGIIENAVSKIYAEVDSINGTNWIVGLFNADRQMPADGDVFIKDAIGDEALAPMSVYEQPFIDGIGRYNYKWDGENIVLADESEKPVPQAPDPVPGQEAINAMLLLEIAKLKAGA